MIKKIAILPILALMLTACSSVEDDSIDYDIIDATSELNFINFETKSVSFKEDKADMKHFCFDIDKFSYSSGAVIEYKGYSFHCRIDYGGAWVEESVLGIKSK